MYALMSLSRARQFMNYIDPPYPRGSTVASVISVIAGAPYPAAVCHSARPEIANNETDCSATIPQSRLGRSTEMAER